MLTPEQLKQAIKEFIALYRKTYGVELTDEEATKRAQGLLQLMTIALDITQ